MFIVKWDMQKNKIISSDNVYCCDFDSVGLAVKTAWNHISFFVKRFAQLQQA